MYQDLRVTFNSFIKLFISLGSLIDANLMRNDEAWVCPPRDDHIAQVSVVFLDVTLTGADCKTLRIALDQHRVRANPLKSD